MRWILAAALVTGLGAGLASEASAQAAKAANPKLAGVWEGNYASDGPNGPMTVEFTKASDWGVKVVLGGDAPPAGEPQNVVFDGDVVTWKQVVGDLEIAVKATLNADGSEVSGTMEASQAGTYVGAATFSLKRKP